MIVGVQVWLAVPVALCVGKLEDVIVLVRVGVILGVSLSVDEGLGEAVELLVVL